MKTAPISYTEWRKALEVWEADPDGVSVQELCTATGLKQTAIKERLRKLVASGDCEYAGGRAAERIDGVKCYTPVYRLVKSRKD